MLKASLSDHDLHRRVLDELKWDTQVDETEVGVEVDRGVVTLTGAVSSYAKKWAAQDAAHRVTGVLDVANDLQVKVPDLWKKTDTEVAHSVRQTLEWDALFPHENIKTTVANGWVTLEGSVPYWTDRERAEFIIRGLTGVIGVTNSVTVTAPKVEASVVRRSIESALERRAEREARHLDISVHDGTVVLNGRVNSWYDKQAVIGAAGTARGVREVEDHLQISPL